jgi:hypothetical protein
MRDDRVVLVWAGAAAKHKKRTQRKAVRNIVKYSRSGSLGVLSDGKGEGFREYA